MSTKVVTQPDVLSGVGFAFVVPAGEIWSLRSINALAKRGAGGTPGRAYRVDITDGTTVVGAFGAADAGTDPGTCEITWSQCPAGVGATGANGVVSAPMLVTRLPTGYNIIGVITGAVAGDAWDHATCWVDFATDAAP